MTDDFEQFDEDNIRLDPLEDGMDPPEHWAQADKFGNTEREQREGQDLEHRLAEEQPDVQPEDPDRPRRLDDSIDDDNLDREDVAPQEPEHPLRTDAARSGTSADEAGGSVAEELRTPPQN